MCITERHANNDLQPEKTWPADDAPSTDMDATERVHRYCTKKMMLTLQYNTA